MWIAHFFVCELVGLVCFAVGLARNTGSTDFLLRPEASEVSLKEEERLGSLGTQDSFSSSPFCWSWESQQGLAGVSLRHMEVPRLGVESELQLLAYTTATATQDPRRVCNLHHSSWQHRIPNPLSKARDQTQNLRIPSRIHFCCATVGTPTLRSFHLSATQEKVARLRDELESTE